jgi:hypothetical protein
MLNLEEIEQAAASSIYRRCSRVQTQPAPTNHASEGMVLVSAFRRFDFVILMHDEAILSEPNI